MAQAQGTTLTLAELLADVNRAEYMIEVHYRSHSARGTGWCKACDDHEAGLIEAEAALRAFMAATESAA